MRDLSIYENSDKQLICLRPDEQPIVGYVEFVFGEANSAEVSWISEDGLVNVPLLARVMPDIAIVKPTDGHWPIVASPSQETPCVCPAMRLPDDLLWWRKLPFSEDYHTPWRSAVNIGVIDIPARRCQSLNHVAMYDVEGNPIDDKKLAGNSHGLRVSAMISERGTSFERQGIAPSANITLIDVTDDEIHEDWDYSKIAPAIQILVDEFDVDLINISGGCPLSTDDPRFEEAFRFFSNAIDYANRHGVLVVASAGNNPNAPVALPAILENVVGVGAVGKVSVAPSHSRTGAYENWSFDTPGCIGSLGQEMFFHFQDTSFGHGIDMVGPGIGVVMKFEDGSCVEYDGTSYAAPYVTAVAAIALSLDDEAAGLDGREKHCSLRRLVEELCVDLGMDQDRQGSGIPVLIR